VVQSMCFFVFLKKANFDDENTDWNYTIRCAANNQKCEDEKCVTALGWFIFLVSTFCHYGADITETVFQVRKSLLVGSPRLLFSGYIRLFLIVEAIYTSIFYNIALAETDTELIVNTVILLFINDLDEQVMNLIEILSPTWLKHRNEEIETFMSKGNMRVGSTTDSHCISVTT